MSARFDIALALALAGAALVGGCFIDALDLSGKACDPSSRPDPCAPSSACDPVLRRCQVVDAGVGPEGLVAVSNLKMDWVTPNSIRWVWEASAKQPEDLARYEIRVSESPDDFSAARVYTDRENPELARFRVPGGTGLNDVTGTITDGLDPNKHYYAKLVAIDVFLNESVSNVAAGTTSIEPTGMISILTDAGPPAGSYPLPNDIILSSQPPNAAGQAHYEWTQATDCSASSESGCWENLRWQNLGIALSNPSQPALTITPGTFPSAFIELWLSTDSTSDVFWSELYVAYAQCSYDVDLGANPCQWRFSRWAIRADNQYRKIQIPLAVLEDYRGQRTPFEMISQPLYEVGVGGTWSAGSHVRIDEMSVKW